MFVLAPKRHMTMHIWSQGNWQTTLDRKCCICCILGYITQTTPKTSPSEQIETPIIGDVPGYYVHSPLRWLLIYFYIRNKKLQLTNSVLNTRHDLYQLLNAIWNVLFTSKHNFKRYILQMLSYCCCSKTDIWHIGEMI